MILLNLLPLEFVPTIIHVFACPEAGYSCKILQHEKQSVAKTEIIMRLMLSSE